MQKLPELLLATVLLTGAFGCVHPGEGKLATPTRRNPTRTSVDAASAPARNGAARTVSAVGLDDDPNFEGEPLDSEAIGPSPEGSTAPVEALEWDEVLSGSLDRYETNPAIIFEDAMLTPERLASMPDALRSNPELARLAVTRAIENPIDYHNGVFGMVSGAKFFATTKAQVPNFDHLYRVIVRVLSEKYGCFMISKQNVGESIKFTCRDRRRIVVWRATGGNWIQFYARQYDREGYEIKVVKKQIVRISSDPVL